MGNWILSEEKLPEILDEVEGSDNGVDVQYPDMVYLESRICMMAGIAGGYGYFGEGFAMDGTTCDYGLICDTPKYWRLTE